MAAATLDPWVEVPAHLRCRLLFGSPVCVLVTRNSAPSGAATESAIAVHPFNAMTISWLTAIDNHRRFFLSVNAGRHSLTNLLRDGDFTLSVAVTGMEEALLSFGSESGKWCGCTLAAGEAPDPTAEPAPTRRRCKFSDVLSGQPWVAPGSSSPWQALPPAIPRPPHCALPAHGASPAHLVCRVVSVLGGGAAAEAGGHAPTPPSTVRDAGPAASATASACEAGAAGKRGAGSTSKPRPPPIQHALLECEIDAAFVLRRYWHMGKIFGAEATGPYLPPPLAFAGTQRFATITLKPLDATPSTGAGGGVGSVTVAEDSTTNGEPFSGSVAGTKRPAGGP